MPLKKIRGFRFPLVAGLALTSGLTATHAPNNISLRTTPTAGGVVRREEHHKDTHHEEKREPRPFGFAPDIRQSTATSQAHVPLVIYSTSGPSSSW